MEKIKKLWAYYFRPDSWTWLVGLGAIALAAAQVAKPEYMPVQLLSDIVAGLNGVSSDPAQLAVLGLGLLGLGARKDKDS